MREEEVAIQVALDRIEEGVRWLRLGLQFLGFLKEARGRGEVTGLMERVRQSCALAEALEVVAASVGGFDRTSCGLGSFVDFSER